MVLFHSLFNAISHTPTVVLFTFLIFAVIPGDVLTSEDLELGISYEREHTTSVLLGIGFLTKVIYSLLLNILSFLIYSKLYILSLSPNITSSA